MTSRFLSLTVVFAMAASLRAAPPTAADIAAHLDDVRRPQKSFQARIKITEIRDGKVDSVTEFDFFARKTGGYPDFESLARGVQPEAEAGKALLIKGAKAWIYDPDSSRPVSVSYEKMRGKFFFSYGLTSSFVAEYQATLAGTEVILDAARKERACLRVDFTHRDDGAGAPEKLQYWVDADTLRPVRGHVLSRSGRVLRAVYYTRFQRLLGRDRPTRLLVVSGTERGLLIDVDFSQLAHREMPAEAFTPEALPAFSRTGAP